MKFSIVLSEIIKQIQEVSGIASSSPNKEDVTQNMLITVKDHTLSLRATDYNIDLEAVIPVADVESEGAAIVNAAKLRDMCKNLDVNSNIFFNLDDSEGGTLIVKSDNTTFDIRTKSFEFPSFQSEPVSQTISLTQKQLKNVLDSAIFCISPDDFRDYLRGMRFEANESQLSVFTSDGHRMAFIEAKLLQPVTELFGAVGTKKSVMQLARILDPNSDARVDLNFSKSNLSVFCNGYNLLSKLILCGYPNVRSVIPKQIDAVVTIPRQALRNQITRVSVLSSRRVNGITFKFADNLLSMRTENAEHEVATSQMAINYTGAPVEVSLNATYIYEVLSNSNCEDIEFHFSTPLQHLLVSPPQKEQPTDVTLRYLISKVII